MNTEIICSLVAGFGVALSALVSWFTARHTAKAEIKRLQAVWAHEEEAADNAALEEMISAVSLYVKNTSLPAFVAAQESVSVCRVRVAGELGQLVDELDTLVIRATPDRAAVSKKLDQVVQCKRGNKGR